MGRPAKTIPYYQTMPKVKLEKFIGLYESLVGGNNLVVGCGVGDEIKNLASCFPSSNFVGIDIEITVEESEENWRTIYMDAQKLTFDPESFDFVYCYHVLEHVSDPEIVLEQIKLVLKPQGFALVGTPNKNRILGYFSSENSLVDKIKWNYDDLSKKFRGKFENKYGAHAGFTTQEMKTMLERNFLEVNDVSNQYYIHLYPNYHFILRIFHFLKLSDYIFPSIYFTFGPSSESKM